MGNNVSKRSIAIDHKNSYLWIPICCSQNKQWIRLIQNGQAVTEFKIPIPQVAVETFDFWGKIPTSLFAEGELEIEGEVEQWYLEQITLAPQTQTPSKYGLHYAPSAGWMNDPNGLVYYGGVYHLYYQYNPFDLEWGNMCWGHAISSDLVHWDEEELVMMPDQEGMIFSGCGLVNRQKMLDLSDDALLFFYTAAGGTNPLSEGREFVQKTAYSIDGGQTFIKMPGDTIPTICKENRDPKIFWHEKTKQYIACLWLEEDEFAILQSKDLVNWKLSQRFSLENGFECPDLFSLTSEDGKQPWFVWTADGYYYEGDFDGNKFQQTKKLKKAYVTKHPYAATSYSNVEGVVNISWLRTTQKDNHVGTMSIPRMFSLGEDEDGFYIRQNLEDGVMKEFFLAECIEATDTFNVQVGSEDVWMLTIAIREVPTKSRALEFSIYGQPFSVDLAQGIFSGSTQETIEIGKPIREMTIIHDHGLLEITFNYERFLGIVELGPSIKRKEIAVVGDIFQLNWSKKRD